MMSTEATCEQRIDEQLFDLAELMTEYMKFGDLYENGDEDNYPPFHEYGLDFSLVEAGTFDGQTESYWRYQLSWGGPSDEVRFYADKIEYWFLDWFDGASRDITGEQWAQDLEENWRELDENYDAKLTDEYEV